MMMIPVSILVLRILELFDTDLTPSRAKNELKIRYENDWLTINH